MVAIEGLLYRALGDKRDAQIVANAGKNCIEVVKGEHYLGAY